METHEVANPDGTTRTVLVMTMREYFETYHGWTAEGLRRHAAEIAAERRAKYGPKPVQLALFTEEGMGNG